MATLLTGTAVKDATSVSNPTAEPLQEDDVTDHQQRRRDGGWWRGCGRRVGGLWLPGRQVVVARSGGRQGLTSLSGLTGSEMV